jgi:2Fe-2S ferredoxin
MPKVTFIEHDGTAHAVEAQTGLSLMLAAITNNVPGIDADCGGECACATCHVYIEPEWGQKVTEASGPPNGQEASMLSFAATTQANSRLACQITVTEALDGLTVRMPDGQH